MKIMKRLAAIGAATLVLQMMVVMPAQATDDCYFAGGDLEVLITSGDSTALYVDSGDNTEEESVYCGSESWEKDSVETITVIDYNGGYLYVYLTDFDDSSVLADWSGIEFYIDLTEGGAVEFYGYQEDLLVSKANQLNFKMDDESFSETTTGLSGEYANDPDASDLYLYGGYDDDVLSILGSEWDYVDIDGVGGDDVIYGSMYGEEDIDCGDYEDSVKNVVYPGSAGNGELDQLEDCHKISFANVSEDLELGGTSSTSVYGARWETDLDDGSSYDNEEVTIVLGSGDDFAGRYEEQWRRVYGGPGDDILYGTSLEDQLFGGRGDDKLYGADYDDKLIGGMGIDYANGGRNEDAAGDICRAEKMVDCEFTH